MKFMLLMQGTKAGWELMASWSPADIKAHIDFMLKLRDDLLKTGELVLAEGLDLPGNAKIVRALKEGAPTVMDGPFPETKEFLAGFWMIDCETPQRAVEIAARASTAPGRGGAPLGIPIEVRQVMSHPEVEA
jgi:hypothetical protein